MKKQILLTLLIVFSLALSACTAGPNDLQNVQNQEDKVAGFWLGLWHGIISPVTFVISLFNDNISMYEVHNNGGWYDFGFLFGAIIIFGGGGGGAGKRSRR